VKCPDGSQPVNGTCPTTIIDNNTMEGGNNNESKSLSLSITVAKDPIVRGHKQSITVKVSDENSHHRISGASVQGNVRYASGSYDNGSKFSGLTDNNGVISHTWSISTNAIPGKFTAKVHVSDEGYRSATGTKSFMVKPSGPDTGGGGGRGQNQ
jgi:hypothetical protein